MTKAPPWSLFLTALLMLRVPSMALRRGLATCSGPLGPWRNRVPFSIQWAPPFTSMAKQATSSAQTTKSTSGLCLAALTP